MRLASRQNHPQSPNSVAHFSDVKGDRWPVAFSVGIARRLKNELDIDINDPKALADAIDDLYKRFDLLWACCAPLAEERGLTVDDFDALISPAFADASTALVEALQDFFHSSGQVRMVAILSRALAVHARIDSTAVAKLNSPETDAALERVMRQAEADIDRELAKLGPPPPAPPVIGGNGSNTRLAS